MTDFEALYYALNKLNEIKNTTNEKEICEIQIAIMTHIEEQKKKEAAATETIEKHLARTKAILKEMDEIAERGLRA